MAFLPWKIGSGVGPGRPVSNRGREERVLETFLLRLGREGPAGWGERLRSLGSPRVQGPGARTGVRSRRGKNRRGPRCNTATRWERGAPWDRDRRTDRNRDPR